MNTVYTKEKEKGKGGKVGRKVPKEAVAFAKQMGIPLDGLEAEADDIWRMLDTMSRNDSAGYDKFVQEQLSRGKEENVVEKETKYFRPKAEFCIYSNTESGDGVKVREVGSKKKSGKVLYVNICSSQAIACAKDKNGNDALDDRASADGLEIPLVIGPVRDFTLAMQQDDDTDLPPPPSIVFSKEEAPRSDLVVDVVFHPSLIGRCVRHANFKSQIVDLALEWVGNERGVKVHHEGPMGAYSWKDVMGNVAYKGGRGADHLTPVLFPIPDGEGSDKKDTSSPVVGTGREMLSGTLSSSGVGKGTDALASPIDLLHQKHKNEHLASSAADNFAKAAADSFGKKEVQQNHVKANKAKIVELNENGQPAVPEVTASEHAPKASKPSIKKGFLNKTNKKSGLGFDDEEVAKQKSWEEEQVRLGNDPKKKPSTYASLMEKCQVVNLPPGVTEPDQAMMESLVDGKGKPSGKKTEYAAPVSDPAAVPKALPVQARSNLGSASSDKGASAVAKPAAAEESVLTASKQREMRDLFRDLDEDWSSSDGTAKANEDEVITEQFAAFAKAMGVTGTEGGLDMSTLAGLCKDPKAIRKAADVNIPLAKPPVPVPVAKQELTLQHRAAKGAPTLAATVEKSDNVVTVTVSGEGSKNIDLQVSLDQMLLKVSDTYTIQLNTHGIKMDQSSTLAKYSKKSKALRISVTVS